MPKDVNSHWTKTQYSRKGISHDDNRVLIKRGPYGGSEGRILSRTKNGWLRIELYPQGGGVVIKVRNSTLNLDKPLIVKNKSYAWWVAGDSKMLQMEQAENLAAMQSDWPDEVENMAGSVHSCSTLESDDDRLPLGLRLHGAGSVQQADYTTTGCLPGCLCPEQGLHHKLCPNGGKSYDYEWRNSTEQAEEEAAWAMFEEVLEHRRRQEDEEGQQGEGGFSMAGSATTTWSEAKWGGRGAQRSGAEKPTPVSLGILGVACITKLNAELKLSQR